MTSQDIAPQHFHQNYFENRNLIILELRSSDYKTKHFQQNYFDIEHQTFATNITKLFGTMSKLHTNICNKTYKIISIDVDKIPSHIIL